MRRTANRRTSRPSTTDSGGASTLRSCGGRCSNDSSWASLVRTSTSWPSATNRRDHRPAVGLRAPRCTDAVLTMREPGDPHRTSPSGADAAPAADGTTGRAPSRRSAADRPRRRRGRLRPGSRPPFGRWRSKPMKTLVGCRRLAPEKTATGFARSPTRGAEDLAGAGPGAADVGLAGDDPAGRRVGGGVDQVLERVAFATPVEERPAGHVHHPGVGSGSRSASQRVAAR